MKLKTILLAVLLADFTALTAWALSTLTLETLGATLYTPLGMQMAADIVIALGVALGFIYQDAKKRGLNPAGWIVLTLLTGSIGPLAYLIRREWAEPVALSPAAAT
jgi:hypothetical protein